MQTQGIEQAKRRMFGRLIVIWGIVGIAIAASVAGMVWLAKEGAKPTAGDLADAVTASDWKEGADPAKVTIVEYGDFQCPACGAYYPALKQLGKDFHLELAIVFRNFPLRQVHEHAQITAQAAEAAGKQGKFWEMHDILFERQQEWSDAANPKDFFTSYARTIGLDVARFTATMDAPDVLQAIEDDFQSGLRSNVNGTPTLFLNGKKIQNPNTYNELRDIVQSAIKNS